MSKQPADRNCYMELQQCDNVGKDGLGQPLRVYNKFINLWCSLEEYVRNFQSIETIYADQVTATGIFVIEFVWPGRDIDSAYRFVYGNRVFNINYCTRDTKDIRYLVRANVKEDMSPKPYLAHEFGWIAYDYTEPLVYL